MNTDGYNYENQPVQTTRSGWGTPALAIGLVAVAAFSIFEYAQVKDLRRDVNARQEQQSADIQSQAAAENATLQNTVSDLQSKLADQQAQTTQSLSRVQSAALRHADTETSTLAKSLEQKSAEQQDAFNTELAGVKNAQSDTASKIDGVSTSVDTVKTDLASTKAVADKTATDLERATGDMGVISGLIATNGKQITELRAMGDRNIYEFTITKKAGMQKVGDIQLRLTKTDPKHNAYTVVVMADDKMFEKKDRTTNEPVQFYATPGTRTPDEVVVNQVDKDTIKGYLATPKVTTARN
jgi:hypothetical protein